MIEAFVEKYVPHVRFDRREPFPLVAVGYTVFHQSGASPSCNMQLHLKPEETVIEYAFYYDFDIQHLYDLEHAFVRLDKEGSVTGIISSFHGKFLNAFLPGKTEFENGHPVLYAQPGKHAFMPKPEYFELALERDACCNEYAGSDGLLIAPMFRDSLSKDPETDRKIAAYIKEKYAFEPSWEFTDRCSAQPKTEDILIPWERLRSVIAGRVDSIRQQIEAGEL